MRRCFESKQKNETLDAQLFLSALRRLGARTGRVPVPRRQERPLPRDIEQREMHSDAHFSTVVPRTGIRARTYNVRDLKYCGVGHVVCYRVSREKGWNAFAAAPIQRQSLPRAIGKRRPVHSARRLPRNSILSRQRLFAVDEQQSGRPHAEPDSAAVHPRLEHQPEGLVLPCPLISTNSIGQYAEHYGSRPNTATLFAVARSFPCTLRAGCP